MQNGIISQVLEKAKEGKKTFYEVALQDGTKMTTFDSKIMGGSSGDSLEFEVLVNGKFVNLKDGWKLTKHASSQTESLKTSCNTDERIDTECAIKAVVELRCADKIDPSHPLFLKAMDWLDSKIPGKPVKPIDKPIDFDKDLGRSPEERLEFKTGSELVNYAMKKGVKLDDIKVKLSINNPAEIKDIKAATRILFP